MKLAYHLVGFIVLGCAVTVEHAHAQGPLAVSVRADNDAFDFWMPPWSRPDEEYTSGVRATFEYAGAAWWERWLHRRVTGRGADLEHVATRTYALGQDMYTGRSPPTACRM